MTVRICRLRAGTSGWTGGSTPCPRSASLVGTGGGHRSGRRCRRAPAAAAGCPRPDPGSAAPPAAGRRRPRRHGPWSSTRPGSAREHGRPAQAADSCDSTGPPLTVRRAPGGMLVGSSDRGVHRHHPLQLARGVWAKPCSSPSTRSNVPSLAHRSRRHHTVCHGGKPAGRSRHGDPVRNRQMIASTTSRWSVHRPPRRGARSGSNGSRRAHISSVSTRRSVVMTDTLDPRRPKIRAQPRHHRGGSPNRAPGPRARCAAEPPDGSAEWAARANAAYTPSEKPITASRRPVGAGSETSSSPWMFTRANLPGRHTDQICRYSSRLSSRAAVTGPTRWRYSPWAAASWARATAAKSSVVGGFVHSGSGLRKCSGRAGRSPCRTSTTTSVLDRVRGSARITRSRLDGYWSAQTRDELSRRRVRGVDVGWQRRQGRCEGSRWGDLGHGGRRHLQPGCAARRVPGRLAAQT